MAVENPDIIHAMASVVGVGGSIPRLLQKAGIAEVEISSGGYLLTLDQAIDSKEALCMVSCRDGYASVSNVTYVSDTTIRVTLFGVDGVARLGNFDIVVMRFPQGPVAGTAGTVLNPPQAEAAAIPLRGFVAGGRLLADGTLSDAFGCTAAKNSTGNYTITCATPITDDHAAFLATVDEAGAAKLVNVTQASATTYTVTTYAVDGTTATDGIIMFGILNVSAP